MRIDKDIALVATLPAQRQAIAIVSIFALLLALVLAMFQPVTASMVAIWSRSETFAHGFVVVPIVLYLVWRERYELAALQPAPVYGALAGVAVCAAIAWLGMRMSAVSVPQFAVVAMFCFALWTVLGTAIVRALAFPLALLFFAVPFGEFLVPTLIDRTADFTVVAIRASGVPIYREGNSFMIPSGRWSVVEACSGLRYLIASVMVGTLFAWLTYRSLSRRLLFIAASIAVPLVANWLRAYMIVMLGHVSNNRIAIGVDHLIYGWLFFGVVMLLLFLIGARWREDRDVRRTEATDVMPWPARVSTTRIGIAAAATTAIIAAGAAWALATPSAAPSAAIRLAPLGPVDGWRSTTAPVSAWRPDLSGAAVELDQAFEKDRARIGVHVALYRDQTRDTKAITTSNQLVRPSNAAWERAGGSSITIDVEGRRLPVRTATIVGTRERLTAWQWFSVDGKVTTSEYVAALYQAMSLLRGHGDAVAWVVLYTPQTDGDAAADAALRDFASAALPSIDSSLRQAEAAR